MASKTLTRPTAAQIAASWNWFVKNSNEIYKRETSSMKHFKTVELWATSLANAYATTCVSPMRNLIPANEIAQVLLEIHAWKQEAAKAAAEAVEDADSDAESDSELDLTDSEEVPSSVAELLATKDKSELANGKVILNTILFKQYNDWWEAFEQEAKEDLDKIGWTAEKRFANHAAKILYRKVDREIPREDLVPVVEAWLLLHAEHLKGR
jgi:hypothetical protein